jgi:hypothetical protein
LEKKESWNRKKKLNKESKWAKIFED